MCLPSVLVSALNGILASVSQTAVAFFGVYYKLQTFGQYAYHWCCTGMRPIMSYNYGANQKDRMDQTLKMSTLTIGFILC